MLRPEQMSKVSVAGSQRVQGDVIEAIHDLDLVHLSDYDGSIEGFDVGDPLAGADEASDKLVTVRSLESMLDVSPEDAGPTRIVSEEALETELEEIRVEVNELDDERAALEDDLRSVEERIDSVAPFADLGLDLDLLSGYDSLQVAVGHGDAEDIRAELDASDAVEAYEVFEGDETVGVFVYPRDGNPEALDDALVGVDFARLEIPDAEGRPEAYLDDLRAERRDVEADLERVESELDELRKEHAGFLLAAEEKLSIDVQKTEVPLQFATTDHAFVAEGWIPTEEYATFEDAVQTAVGEHAAVEELEQADYEPEEHHQPSDEEAAEAAEDDGDAPAAAADGGTTVDFESNESPPVVQDNPGPVKPFEALTEVINRPKYTEIDPTVILFLTFPAFYGFMIGDLGYGILYTAIGYWLYAGFDSDMINKLGGVAMLAGIATAIFGVLYGEFFGLHLITEYLWHGVVGLEDAPMKKGLHVSAFASLWLTLSLVAGALHLVVAYVFGFVNESRAHGVKTAMTESGAKLMLMAGVTVWLFSTHVQGEGGPRPEFLYEVAQFSPEVGLAALVVALVGLVLLTIGEGAVGFVESPTYALVHTVSYTRLAAVLLAKAAMAYVVNLLVFGAYEEVPANAGEPVSYFFGLWTIEMPGHVTHFMLNGVSHGEVLFPGLLWQGPAGILGGVIVLVAGHALVLGLGVTSAGLQSLRLEYVEFFNKFYEGGGEKYNPFGYTRNYTTED
ncbi:ATP synthase subunit I [Halobacterium sp. DL1]|jgi:V/A-type H+-transporting ATPase subunit I|nr:ATP synthase subunit I [Halobacterium sp. DL1]